MRNDIVIHDGTISSLKRFKDDVSELNSNYEGGIGIEKYNDLRDGDSLEAYIMEEIKR
ncbi:MAG: infB [Sedimentibacter sp.]|nr:infB [Sedimentibacter sp.]